MVDLRFKIIKEIFEYSSHLVTIFFGSEEINNHVHLQLVYKRKDNRCSDDETN